MPVLIPSGVDVQISGDKIFVKGSLGVLTQSIHPSVQVKQDGSLLRVALVEGGQNADAISGTFRALINNMVHGVSKGYEKRLSLVGVGYKAQVASNKLNLQIGFSHPVNKEMPDGIKVECPTPTEIVIKGVNRQVVGQIASEVRAFRPPEPYKGKGIRYVGEKVVLKETKKK